ncbi:MAG: hypothetical protein K5668_09665 [Lachnospiraceae bacterium]|nr:hypothetical protein [Lachnospiraceae bacterium]
MSFIIILLGIALMALGVFIFKKLPGIKLKIVRIIFLLGLLTLLAGILIAAYKPLKGLLPDGSADIKENDDASGLDIDTDLSEIAENTLIVDGDRIIMRNRVFEDTADFREYIASEEAPKGLDLVDRYAVYSVYEEVLKILETNGIEILSEKSAG